MMETRREAIRKLDDQPRSLHPTPPPKKSEKLGHRDDELVRRELTNTHTISQN